MAVDFNKKRAIKSSLDSYSSLLKTAGLTLQKNKVG